MEKNGWIILTEIWNTQTRNWTLRTAIDYIKSLEDGLRTDFTQQKVKVVNLKTKKQEISKLNREEKKKKKGK